MHKSSPEEDRITSRIRFLLDNCHSFPLLNIGCGGSQIMTGNIMKYLEAYRIINLDLDMFLLSPIKNFIQADGLFLPFQDESFGTVYLGEVIEHVWDARKLIVESYRVLKPQGTIVLDTPNVYHWVHLRQFIIGRKSCLGSRDHKILYSVDSLRQLLYDCGFAQLKFDYKGHTWRFSKTILAVGLKRIS